MRIGKEVADFFTHHLIAEGGLYFNSKPQRQYAEILKQRVRENFDELFDLTKPGWARKVGFINLIKLLNLYGTEFEVSPGRHAKIVYNNQRQFEEFVAADYTLFMDHIAYVRSILIPALERTIDGFKGDPDR